MDYVIAKEQLFVDGVLAHNIGDRVPADNVKRNGWDELVAKPGTKAAEKAVEQDPA